MRSWQFISGSASVTKTQATISMGLHKSDLGLLLMKTLSKFLLPEKLRDSLSKHVSAKAKGTKRKAKSEIQ